MACESLPCPCSTGGGGGGAGTDKPKKKRVIWLKGKVVDVVDGDTIDVRTRPREERVRLIGIDTPEVYGGTECGGPEASATMKRLAQSRRVKLVTDPTQDVRDRYGRLLAYAHVIDGPSLQIAILRKGWAKVNVYAGKPFKRVMPFRRAEGAARAAPAGTGLLGASASLWHQRSVRKISAQAARAGAGLGRAARMRGDAPSSSRPTSAVRLCPSRGSTGPLREPLCPSGGPTRV